MTYISRRLLITAAAASLAGCATNSFRTMKPAAAGLSLKNTKVYAYSFLDLRDHEFGASMLGEIDRQLVEVLGQSGVTLKVLRFRESDIGRSFTMTSGGMYVPVRQTVESNAGPEKAFGTTYRLTIFPQKITLTGAWKHYEIRWDLFDVRTGQMVWSSLSEGKHLTLWKNDEQPQERAKTIVDSAVAEMKQSGLF
ncbi:MAG TPA: hypothetical protein H9903_08880 [Candidatus Aquabacterium excrementipullorum]|nr:hypothetical protein [Candidatus Aquabacterium excrementipullorum]